MLILFLVNIVVCLESFLVAVVFSTCRTWFNIDHMTCGFTNVYSSGNTYAATKCYGSIIFWNNKILYWIHIIFIHCGWTMICYSRTNKACTHDVSLGSSDATWSKCFSIVSCKNADFVQRIFIKSDKSAAAQPRLGGPMHS